VASRQGKRDGGQGKVREEGQTLLMERWLMGGGTGGLSIKTGYGEKKPYTTIDNISGLG
jgi:hypothetical protein